MGRRGTKAGAPFPKNPTDDAAEPVVVIGTATNYQSMASNDMPVGTGHDTTTARQHQDESEDGLWKPGSSSSIHRGFSTSIHDMFQSPSQERVDCCAMTCCGMFQSDRDRYLLTGIAPPSPVKRTCVHFVLPFTIVFCAGFAATHVPDAFLKQMVCYALVFLTAGFGILQLYKGHLKRVEVRRDLLYTKYQVARGEDFNLTVHRGRPDPDDDEGAEYYEGQGESDFLSAHPCCCLSCYKDDRMNQKSEPTTLPQKLWSWLYPSPLCGQLIQCCGTCALAQEAREIERAFPARYRRIDYITMQPMMDYFPGLFRYRTDPTGWPPLSFLSQRIVRWAAAGVGLAFVWSIFGPVYWTFIVKVGRVRKHVFSIPDFVVFLLTILESVGLLALLAFYVNSPKKSNLSYDAIIKFFAAGFCLSTTLAVFWELLCGLVVRMFVMAGLQLSGVGVEQDPEDSGNYVMPFGGRFLATDSAPTTNDYLTSAGRSHPFLFTIYLAISTFILAAFIEEVTKYFGFRMVEHPDLMTEQELREGQKLVQNDEHDDDKTNDNDQVLFGYVHSLESRGAAVTLAMLSVAMGFTCCENLVYIFFYSGTSVLTEFSVLLARSLFPVHPICAAIQSIGVVRRDVEKNRGTSFGMNILSPAVLVHGSYDFLIVWIDFIATRKNVDGQVPAFASSISFFLSVVILVAAVTYYLQESKKQQNRLSDLDHRATVDSSGLL